MLDLDAYFRGLGGVPSSSDFQIVLDTIQMGGPEIQRVAGGVPELCRKVITVDQHFRESLREASDALDIARAKLHEAHAQKLPTEKAWFEKTRANGKWAALNSSRYRTIDWILNEYKDELISVREKLVVLSKQ